MSIYLHGFVPLSEGKINHGHKQADATQLEWPTLTAKASRPNPPQPLRQSLLFSAGDFYNLYEMI